MKTASPAMIALLETGGPFWMADLYTITSIYGDVFYLTDSDIDITVGANTYARSGYILTRTQVRQVVGLETDKMTITLAAPPNDVLGGGSPYSGHSVLAAVNAGYLDGATFTVDKAIGATPGDTSAGTINVFTGRVGDVQVSRNVATIEVRSPLELLDMQLPRVVYQYGCIHTLFDAGCAANRATFVVNDSAGTGSTQNSIIFSGTTHADGYMALGTIKFTSGANNGFSIGIRDYVSNVATLSYGLPHMPAPGDTFIAYPGCDKQLSTCTNKFGNVVNFKGFPFVPTPETVL
jgi:uncharacterized phage protein (TIGR02218 family)